MVGQDQCTVPYHTMAVRIVPPGDGKWYSPNPKPKPKPNPYASQDGEFPITSRTTATSCREAAVRPCTHLELRSSGTGVEVGASVGVGAGMGLGLRSGIIWVTLAR